MIIFLASSLIAIVVSFLCSLAEAVLLSLNPIRLETLRQQGRPFASSWLAMKQNVGRPIAAILILNTVAHTGGATIAGGAFDEIYGDEWLWLFSTVFTFVILFGTEIIPKVLGVTFNERLAPVIAPVLRFSITILQPIIFLTEFVSSLLKGKGEESGLSIADLQTLARVAKTKNLIEAEQENIILNAVKFHETKVQAVMIPREWIVCLSANLPVEANFEIAKNNFHTRYPISETESVDDIIGYINFKEMATFAFDFKALKLEALIRPILHVRADANLNTMLKLFIAKRHHLALVKNTDGRVIGMVTLEDVVEEIVGDIEDEFDLSSTEIIQVGAQSWKAGGDVNMKLISEKVGVVCGETAASQTLAQWFAANTAQSLCPGCTQMLGPLRVTIQRVRRGKVHQAKIEVAAPVN